MGNGALAAHLDNSDARSMRASRRIVAEACVYFLPVGARAGAGAGAGAFAGSAFGKGTGLSDNVRR